MRPDLEKLRRTKTLEGWRKHLNHLRRELSKVEATDAASDPIWADWYRAEVNAFESKIEDTKAILDSFVSE